jgi:tetratricopeptide (TPR) repeat protein/DNA-binding XRE family transcriptional regulator
MGTEEASEAKNSSRPNIPRLRQEREQRGWTQSEVAERIGSTRITISRWEKGIMVPSPYYRQRLGELFGKSILELGLIPERSDSIPARLIWNVPYRRNPFFTGREAILAHLYTVLRSRNAAALTQAQAISGLGGIGKTQIAVEYAYRYRDHYQAIFWINASTREVLSVDLSKLAALLDLPEQHEQDQDIVVRAVKRWLITRTQWLLILDNVEKPEMIVDFLPMDVMGDVLLTTRLQALGTVAQSIEVEKMELDESVMFLLRRIRLLAPDASLDQAAEENQSQANEIATALDGLPLALDQAGAYIEETRCGLSQYFNLYGTRRRELLLRRGRFSVDHPDSVVATWSISFQQVERESPIAVDLLRLLAFLNPEGIPEEIITLGATDLGEELSAAADDPYVLDAIIELLLRYSLIGRNSEAKTLSMHRLVQAVLKDGMDREAQHVWAERATRAVNRAFPDIELKTWEKCRRYLPHVYICARYVDEYGLAFPEAARLLNDAAAYLIVQAQYRQAERLLQTALAIRQHILEANHPDMARTLNDLGVLYRSTGEYSHAEQFHQRALRVQEQVLGRTHQDVAQTQYHLARLYRAKGEYLKAEPCYLQALHIREMTLGIDHPLVAQSYYGLAKLYQSLEKYQQAEKLCNQALYIQEQRLGDNDPMIASTLDILAKIYLRQNKLDQAEEMNMRALRIRESTFGEEHPLVAVIVNNLVEIYHARGRYREAELLINRALRIHEQSFGSEHPYMAYSISNRAENFYLRKNYVQAESYYKQALAIREQKLGVNHPRTASTYYNLAILYTRIERYEEAESFYLKALFGRERAFGGDHPAVTRTLEQYAVLLRKLKREPKARELEKRIQAIKARQTALESP